MKMKTTSCMHVAKLGMAWTMDGWTSTTAKRRLLATTTGLFLLFSFCSYLCIDSSRYLPSNNNNNLAAARMHALVGAYYMHGHAVQCSAVRVCDGGETT